jgi:hypothetical protein
MQIVKTLSTAASQIICTDGGMLVDRERLTYATRAVNGRYLLMVWIGTFFFLNECLDELGYMWSGPVRLLVALAKVALLVIFAMAIQRDWIDGYYKKRFGSVEAPRLSPKEAKTFVLSVVFVLLLLFFYWPLTHYLGPPTSRVADRVHAMMSDTTHQINLWPSCYWLALFLATLRRRPGRIERQNQFLALLELTASAFIVSVAVWHAGVRQSELWRILNAGGLWLSFIAWGLFEHIRLTRLLPKRASEHDDE